MYSEKERAAGTPCSYSQEMLIFNNELDPFNPAHNESFWVPLRGKLDVGALHNATRYLCDRHTILMSRFALTVWPLSASPRIDRHPPRLLMTLLFFSISVPFSFRQLFPFSRCVECLSKMPCLLLLRSVYLSPDMVHTAVVVASHWGPKLSDMSTPAAQHAH